jgi:DNA-binding NarL/FixJ family response regulator
VFELTAHEIRLLELMCCGLSHSEMEATLGVGEETVHADVARIRTKMAVDSRTKACVKALRAWIDSLTESDSGAKAIEHTLDDLLTGV